MELILFGRAAAHPTGVRLMMQHPRNDHMVCDLPAGGLYSALTTIADKKRTPFHAYAFFFKDAKIKEVLPNAETRGCDAD